MFQIWLLSAFMRSFQISFLLFLPIFYNEKLINEIQLGYLGSLFLVWTFIGSTLWLGWLQWLSSKRNLLIAIFCCIVGIIAMIISPNFLIISFLLTWIWTGIWATAISDIQHWATKQNNRFNKLANISMFGDILRISLPIIIWLLYKFSGLSALYYFILLIWISLYIFVLSNNNLGTAIRKNKGKTTDLKELLKNKSYIFWLVMEFLDGFSSATLFVFLPLLLVAKWMNFENSVIFQSIIFLGYFCGRWLMAKIASLSNGYRSVMVAEITMVAAIIWLILIKSYLVIYLLCFILGIATRWTSPVIKWVVFDNLKSEEAKAGSALFVTIWNIADICGQFAFWLLFAHVGIHWPFWMSAGVALLLIIMCVLKIKKT